MDNFYLVIWVVLLLGVGFILGAIVVATAPDTVIPDASEYQAPDQVYLVTIDDVTFTCSSKPVVKNEYIQLRYCKETFGGIVRIQNYKSFSFRAVNVE